MCNTSQNEDGSLERQEFQHVILLSAVYGDSPGLAKVANCIGASGKRGCFFCTIPGEYVPENHHVYFAAYNEPVESMVKTDDGWRVEAVKCGDPRARLSHQDQVQRDRDVEEGRLEANEAGSHGSCVLVKCLDYIDYNNVFVVPIAHAALLGSVKDFWWQLLSRLRRNHPLAISSFAKKIMASRLKHLKATCDFGRG